MKRIFALLVLFQFMGVTFLFAGASKFAQKQERQKVNRGVEMKSRENSHYLPDRVIVKFKNQPSLSKGATGIQSVDEILGKYSAKSVQKIFENKLTPTDAKQVDLSRFYVVTFNAPYDAFTVAEELSQQDEIEYAEPWFIYPLDACPPNDPMRSSQWHLTKVLADTAWCLQQGDTSIVIAIVDTGIELAHPDLTANIWHNPGETGGGKETNGMDDDGNGKVDDWQGWDFGGADYRSPVEDNNPSPTANNNAHGTHVAGIASAATNNGVGVAGMAYNCKLLAVKTTSDNDTRGSGGTPYVVFGFEGIVYAADMGADVINCSWGGGGYSQFEQEIINYASSLGAVVVAAAGNAGNETPNYPASYDGVYSVAATNSSDGKASFSQYGAYIDVCAPGTSIMSTVWQSTYTNSYSGTSMASPLAAGLIALVKSRFPSYSMIQAAEQVRISCDNIDGINSIYRYKLGRGRINALKALTITSPSVRYSNLVLDDAAGGNGNGIPEREETLSVSMTFTNYLAATSSAIVTFTTTDTYVQLLDTSFTLGALSTGQSLSNASTPFRVAVKNTMPFNRSVNFKVTIQDGDYTDVYLITVLMNPTYNNHIANNVKLTLTNKGGIGFNDFPNNRQGVGFIFGGANQLFEGGLLIGYSTTKIVNVVRNPNGTQDADFASNQTYTISHSGVDEVGSTMFTDSIASATQKIGVRVNMYSYAFSAAPHNNYVIVRYDIQNMSGATISNLYAGLFFDWDIQNYSTNKTDYDSSRNLGYAWDAGSAGSVYCGTRIFEQAAGYRGLINNANIDLSDAAKFNWLSGGVVRDTTTEDIHYAVSSGPYTIANGASVIVAFALIGGTDLADLQASADAALAKWNEIKTSLDVDEKGGPLPTVYSLSQNYPNPFNPTTEIKYQTSEVGNVLLKIYDVLGREVATLVNERKPAGTYSVRWNAEGVPSGVYFYRVIANGYVETKKMILMR